MTSKYAIPHQQLISWEVAKLDAAFHKRNINYQIPASIRAAAFALQHPNYQVTGFAALALYGLKYFVDSCDTVLMSGTVRRNAPPGASSPAIIRGSMRDAETWTVICRGTKIQTAAPALALVQALKVLRRGENGWAVLGCGGLDPTFVRAVQLTDACRQQLGIQTSEILAAGQQRIEKRWLADVLAASSSAADSPKETEMRLMAAQVAKIFDLVLAEQVPVTSNGTWVTRLDLALTKPGTTLRLGLMYDGEHHLQNKHQWQKDNSIDHRCAELGWDMHRFISTTLCDMVGTLVVVIARELGVEVPPAAAQLVEAAKQSSRESSDLVF